MRAIALLCLAAVGCAGTSLEQELATASTELAHGTNAMYQMHATLCSGPRLATKECQDAAGYYEFASCQFEKVNHWLGGRDISEACKP